MIVPSTRRVLVGHTQIGKEDGKEKPETSYQWYLINALITPTSTWHQKTASDIIVPTNYS